jgi:hypothetical protein
MHETSTASQVLFARPARSLAPPIYLPLLPPHSSRPCSPSCRSLAWVESVTVAQEKLGDVHRRCRQRHGAHERASGRSLLTSSPPRMSRSSDDRGVRVGQPASNGWIAARHALANIAIRWVPLTR